MRPVTGKSTSDVPTPCRHFLLDRQGEGIQSWSTTPRSVAIQVHTGILPGSSTSSETTRATSPLATSRTFCLGAGTDRKIARIGLSSSFEGFPGVQLATETDVQPLPTLIMNGHREMPVSLGTPAHAGE